jgi:O-antigen/teichoic acid export membrane protein
VAPHFIHVIYGERWIGAIVPLQILCFSGLPRSVLTTMGTIFNAKGRPDIELKWNCVTFFLVVAAVLVGARYGIIGVAWAMMITSYLSFLAMWNALRLAGINVAAYLQALMPALVGSLLIVLAVVSVDRYVLSGHGFSHLLLLAAEVVTGVLVYGAYLMLVHRDLIEEATALIRSGVRASG